MLEWMDNSPAPQFAGLVDIPPHSPSEEAGDETPVITFFVDFLPAAMQRAFSDTSYENLPVTPRVSPASGSPSSPHMLDQRKQYGISDELTRALSAMAPGGPVISVSPIATVEPGAERSSASIADSSTNGMHADQQLFKQVPSSSAFSANFKSMLGFLHRRFGTYFERVLCALGSRFLIETCDE